MEYPLDLTIIVPLFNEEESLPELTAWIHRVIDPKGWKFEIIMIDDGSRDGSWDTVSRLASSDDTIHGIRFRRNYGKSAALYHGFKAARGRVVVTMDADLQDSPEEIPEMFRMVTEDGWDVVSGWKQHRQDNKLTKNLPSKLYNATARWITGIRLHDMNCGLKAYKNEVIKDIEVYGEMHRYIPYLRKMPDTRESPKSRCTTEKKIRKEQIRNGAFCQWLPGSPVTLVPEHLRKEADALLRIHRNPDVPCRLHPHRYSDFRQTDSSGRRHAFQTCDRPASLLSGAPFRHTGSDAVPCRIHLRDGFTKFDGT